MEMKNLLIIFLCIVLSSCGAQKKALQKSTETKKETKADEQLVKQCFENYKSAILNDRGEEAVEYVDSRTIKYYQDILDKTKSADSLEVSEMNIMDKLMVFTIRHRTSKEDILKFDGKQLLVYAIQEGMVGKNSVANNEIGQVDIDDDFAKGQLVVYGEPAPMYFHFYNEQEQWKVDLTSLFPIATPAFQKMADESGQNENEYLFMLLEMVSGEKPNSDIWKTIE